MRLRLQCVALLLMGVVMAARGHLFPVNTVIQIVAAISWPIEIPDRKLFMNTGFQFNYNLANQLSTFYKPAFFPYDSRALLDAGNDTIAVTGSTNNTITTANTDDDDDDDDNGAGAEARTARRRQPRETSYSRSSSRSPNHFDSSSSSLSAPDDDDVMSDCDRRLLPSHMPPSLSSSSHHHDVDKYLVAHRHCDVDNGDGGDVVVGGGDCNTAATADMSAGELYRSFEDTLHESGFHRSCLEKSVCQLARHPLHIGRRDTDAADEDHEDLLAEVLHFVLTPSEHQGFDRHEHTERHRFEAAEEAGRAGADCELLYGDCESSLLDYVTTTELSN